MPYARPTSDMGRDHMVRCTLRITKAHQEKLDRLVESGEFPSRSEAIRAGIRTLHDPADRIR